MPEPQSYISKSRTEAFSDGVFAIVVTLLVLEIRVPQILDHHSSWELAEALRAMVPKVLSWIISFLMVCVIWVNHHRIFGQLKTVTHELFWHNAHLLLWCSFIPFPTALMGDYFENRVSVIVFGGILAMMGLAFAVMRLRILKQQFVFAEHTDVERFRKASVQSLVFGPGLYLLGAALSLVHPFVSVAIYVFIPFYFIVFGSGKSTEGRKGSEL